MWRCATSVGRPRGSHPTAACLPELPSSPGTLLLPAPSPAPTPRWRTPSTRILESRVQKTGVALPLAPAPANRKHDVHFYSRVLDREIRPADVYNLFDNSDQDFDLFWAEVTSYSKLTDLPENQGYRQRSAQILAAMCDNLDLQDSRRKA